MPYLRALLVFPAAVFVIGMIVAGPLTPGALAVNVVKHPSLPTLTIQIQRNNCHRAAMRHICYRRCENERLKCLRYWRNSPSHAAYNCPITYKQCFHNCCYYG